MRSHRRARFPIQTFLLVTVAPAVVALAGAWIWAGRAQGPTIAVRQPTRFIGQTTPLDVTVESPGGQFSSVEVVLQQGERSYPIFTLDQPTQGSVRQDTAERIYIIRPVGKRSVPELQAGAAWMWRGSCCTTTRRYTSASSPPRRTRVASVAGAPASGSL